MSDADMNDAPTMPALLNRVVTRRSNEIAFIDGDRHVTFAEFDRLCTCATRWLQSHGVGPGDCVAVWLVNRVEWMALLFALGRIGAVMMSVNTRFRASELEHVLKRSSARMLVMQLNFRRIQFEAVLREVNPESTKALEMIAVLDGGADVPQTILNKPVVSWTLSDNETSEQGAPADEIASPDALSIYFTTSGTTKGPKLVMHTQYTLAVHAQRVSRLFGFDRPGSGTLGAVPFCGTFGLVVALATFAAGAPLVIMDAFDEVRATELIRRHGLTHLFGTEEMLRRLLGANREPTPFPSVKTCGFIMGSALAHAAHERGLSVTGLYGSSEIQGLFCFQPFDLPLEERLLDGGKSAFPDVEVRVRALDSGKLAPPGVSGELEVRSPTRFIGYLGDSDATKSAIDEEGFYRTGDIGRLRGDGSFVFEARLDDAMRISGFLVSSAEIEQVIREAPGVDDAQVVAVETPEGNRSAAFVIRARDFQIAEADLIKWIKGRLANYKTPSFVWFVEAYPITQSANGDKVQRSVLRRMATERIAVS